MSFPRVSRLTGGLDWTSVIVSRLHHETKEDSGPLISGIYSIGGPQIGGFWGTSDVPCRPFSEQITLLYCTTSITELLEPLQNVHDGFHGLLLGASVEFVPYSLPTAWLFRYRMA